MTFSSSILRKCVHFSGERQFITSKSWFFGGANYKKLTNLKGFLVCCSYRTIRFVITVITIYHTKYNIALYWHTKLSLFIFQLWENCCSERKESPTPGKISKNFCCHYIGNTCAVSNYLLTYSMQQSPSWEANWFSS